MKLTAGFTISASLNLVLSGCQSQPYNWIESQRGNDHGGKVTVVELDGLAQWKNRVVAKGDILAGTADINLMEGKMSLLLPDTSIIELSNKAVLQTDLDTGQGGFLNLKKGAMLSVIRKTRPKPIVIRTAAAQFGIRGTVCFTQVLSDDDKKADNRIPSGASSYFCICNGTMEYLSKDFQLMRDDSAKHHSAKFIVPGRDNIQLENAGYLLNHSDEGILNLINKMVGEKHSTSWLFPKHDGYDM